MILNQPEETNDNILSLHFRRQFPDMNEEKRQEFHFKKLLYNDVTKLPTLPVMFDVIQEILNKQGQMGFLYINIVQYSMLEQMYGWRKFDFFMKELASTLVDIRNRLMRVPDAVCEVMIKGTTFMLLLSPPRTRRLMMRDDLSTLCARIGKEFNSELKKRLGSDVSDKLGCYFGYSILEDDPTQRLERLVYTAVEDAHRASVNLKIKDAKRRSSTLHSIVTHKKISTLYQPILDLKNKQIIGYEALNRGPKGEFENPDFLFRLAYENNAVWALDRLCRIQAFRGIKKLRDSENIFINVEPSTFEDPHFFTRETLTEMKNAGVTPEQVVLELTERKAIEDFESFKTILKTFKESGFKVAIDDMGAGYSGLQMLSELLPDYIDFIKIDMSLIRDIDQHNYKQQIISFMLNLTQNIPTSIIVEGIETIDELKTVHQLGIQFAQGFLLASPSKSFPTIPNSLYDNLSGK
ncbi:MAG: EAL domain-containing protein [Candidatus Auribacterota bacterium]|jgi:EAL domain-containing protein (putative c-di-GMP-specific phosphodiesterase class I)|nr:EAL domain-containing protein [Candidatus Auribacterota bacterium]